MLNHHIGKFISISDKLFSPKFRIVNMCVNLFGLFR